MNGKVKEWQKEKQNSVAKLEERIEEREREEHKRRTIL